MAERDLTPGQRAKMRAVAKKFQDDMKKLGLGVTIQVGDDPPVVVTKPPPSPPK